MEAGVPVFGLLVANVGLLGLPEVHMAVPPSQRGRHTFMAIRKAKVWLIENTDWLNVWTFVTDGRVEKLLRYIGFLPAFDKDGRSWFFLPLQRRF
jgi:sulfatase maturation enzyme AslB (radical SAM superfamily)